MTGVFGWAGLLGPAVGAAAAKAAAAVVGAAAEGAALG